MNENITLQFEFNYQIQPPLKVKDIQNNWQNLDPQKLKQYMPQVTPAFQTSVNNKGWL